jgi:membrane-bound lytic murein transglycosylase B
MKRIIGISLVFMAMQTVVSQEQLLAASNPVIGSEKMAEVAAKPVQETHPGQRAWVRSQTDGDLKMAARWNALLDQAKFQQSIVDAMNKPAEGKTWAQYRPIFLTAERLNAGATYIRDNAALFAQAEQRYHVPAEYIAAIIGVETFYGRNTGKYKVLDALTTLAFYYPARAPFFQSELAQFLELDEPGFGLDLANVTGSYAGAMGLGQFMPTSLKKYGQDGDGNQHIDLWASPADIIFSVANYLQQFGWQAGEPVTARLRRQQGAGELGPLDLKPYAPLKTFIDLGYWPRRAVDIKILSSVVSLEGPSGVERFAIFNNFYVITRYNRSPMYAMAVHQLATAIRLANTKEKQAAL